MDEASFEHQPRSSNLPLARDEVRNNTVVDTIKFGAFYHAADVLWVGGALAGDTIAEHGVNRWVAAAGTAIAVTGAEYGLSNVAVETFERTEDIEKDMGTIRKVGSEALAAIYVAICGSSNAVKINDSLGIESTPKRRFAQASIFGSAVGLWVTSIPGFEDGREEVEKYIDNMVDSPSNFILYSAISVGTILTGSKIVKEVRKFFTRNRKTDAQDQI